MARRQVTRKRQGKGNGTEVHANARRNLIMSEAAHLFASRGFEATTIRDIAAAAGILGGSIYYHFQSKEEIFLAVHTAGMESITSAVLAAIKDRDDPWDQLEAAAIAHCSSLLATDELPVIVSPHYPESLRSMRAALVNQRDEYDKIIAGIVERLDLPEHIDRHVFRLHFVGALNWAPTWYRPNSGLSPADIGRQLVAMVKR